MVGLTCAKGALVTALSRPVVLATLTRLAIVLLCFCETGYAMRRRRDATRHYTHGARSNLCLLSHGPLEKRTGVGDETDARKISYL